MSKRNTLISLLLALIAGACIGHSILPGETERLARLSLSPDPKRRANALSALQQPDLGDSTQPRLRRPEVLRYLRQGERLAGASDEVFAEVAEALAAADAIAPTDVGYPAYERYLLESLGNDGLIEPASARRVGQDLLRRITSPDTVNRAELIHLAQALAETVSADAEATHELLLVFATLAGPSQPDVAQPLLDLALASDDAALARDGELLAVVLTETAKPRAAEALLPPSPEPTLELAYWPGPRWRIALRVEVEDDPDLAAQLLRDLDNHVRRAGLLACGLLDLERAQIERLAAGDDDLTNRRYALLARLMNEEDAAEREQLGEAAIVLAESGDLPADDVLFALLAAGSAHGMDWLLDPLRPRRAPDDAALGWSASMNPPAGTTIWPILERFLGPVLQLPPHTGGDPASARRHADRLRLTWLVQRRQVRFDRDERILLRRDGDSGSR
jgi:hypothetical protein